MKKKLDIKNDLVFKIFFCKEENRSLLISFLDTILNLSSPIESLTTLNPVLTSNYIDEKTPILDIMVKLNDGKKIDIEMQMNPLKGFRSRILYYWARLHQSQVKVSGLYASILPTYSISILNYNEFLDGPNKIHNVFKLKEVESNVYYSDDLELHFLELKKYEDWKSQLSEKEKLTKKNEAIISWASFFQLFKLNRSR